MTARTGTLSWLGPILADESLDPTETLLMIGLADHVDAQDECFVGIAILAKYARVSYGTARRRLAALEAAGRLTRVRRRRSDGNLSTYTWTLVRPVPARNLRDDQRASRDALTSGHQGARAEPPSVEPPSQERPDDSLLSLPLSGSERADKTASKERRDTAETLLRAWWESRTPRSTQNYVGARKVLERLLDAGWSTEALRVALVSCPIISAKACELALQRSSPRPVTQLPIDSDRSTGDGEWVVDSSTPGGWRLAEQ